MIFSRPLFKIVFLSLSFLYSYLWSQSKDSFTPSEFYNNFSFSKTETLLALGKPIDSVVVLGRYTLKPFLVKEMSLLKLGDTLTAFKIKRAFDRIFNLQLFHLVSISAKKFYPKISLSHHQPPKGDLKNISDLKTCFETHARTKNRILTVVSIALDERLSPNLLPYVRLQGTNLSRWIKDPSWTNLNFGLKAQYKNPTGHADIIGINFDVGFNIKISIYYYNPNFIPSLKIGGGVLGSYAFVRNISLGMDQRAVSYYRYRVSSASLYFQHRFSDYQSIFLSGNITSISLDPDVRNEYPLSIISETEHTTYPTFVLSYVYRDVDFLQYPLKGINISGSLFLKGLLWQENSLGLLFAFFDVRFYKQIMPSFSIGLRKVARIFLIDRPTPAHERAFFGYDLAVRGYLSNTFEGDNLLFTSLEVRYAIVPVRTIFFDFMPAPYFNKMILGCFLTAFFDVGNIWYNPSTKHVAGSYLKHAKTTFDFSKWIFGYGVGISIVTGYGITARFDVGLNNRNQVEFVFANHVSF